MAELNKMYKGVVNSPVTYLREPLASGGSIIYVIDGSVLGELPNLAVIGNDQTAETVLVKNVRSDGGYDVDRAVEGSAKDWPQMTTVARNFTNYDYEQIRQNLGILNDSIGEVNAVPPGGSTGQVLKKTSSGYAWGSDNNTTYSTATTSANGLMSSADKTKLNNIETGAQVNTVTSVNGQTGAVTTPNTTYNAATTTTNGLMASADKTKLNGIATGAEKNSVTSVAGKTGAVTVTKSDVGLSAVNNVAITQEQVTKINELNYTRAMTQAQYDALSQAEKDRVDVWYGIYKE